MHCQLCNDVRRINEEPCPDCQDDPPPDADYQMLLAVHSGIHAALMAEDENMVVALHDDLCRHLSTDILPQGGPPADAQVKRQLAEEFLEWLLTLHGFVPGLHASPQGHGVALWVGSHRTASRVMDWRTTTPETAAQHLRGAPVYVHRIAEGGRAR